MTRTFSVLRGALAASAWFALVGCQSSWSGQDAALVAGHQPEAHEGLASGFYWQPCASPGQRWAILLPGASGLRIFDDEQHYFRAAHALNARGFDALIVDYKRAYKASPDRPDVPTRQKIKWVVERALAWAQSERNIVPAEPGAIVAWSLGAEGLWPLLADARQAAALGLKAAVAYYPANEDRTPITSPVPLLILQGEADDVTPLAELRELLTASPPPRIQLMVFAEAHHGFDIASIRQKKKIRLFPVIGPSGTFAFHAAAATDANSALEAFLDANVRPLSGSSP